jgi:hypothetical protein
VDTPCRANAADKHSRHGKRVNRPKERPLAAVTQTYTGSSFRTKLLDRPTPVPNKALPSSNRPLTDNLQSAQATLLGMGGRMIPARDRTTFRRANNTGKCKSPPVDLPVQDPGLPAFYDASCETVNASSNEISRDPSQKSNSIEILSNFLLSQNMVSPTPQKLTTNTLRSLYKSVKTRSQLPRLSSDQMTALLSLFGSLSLAHPRPPCIYFSKFVSHIEDSSFRTFWPFVLEIARDKVKLGKPLSGIDRYWIMRAQLANVAVVAGDNPRKCKNSTALTTLYTLLKFDSQLILRYMQFLKQRNNISGFIDIPRIPKSIYHIFGSCSH